MWCSWAQAGVRPAGVVEAVANCVQDHHLGDVGELGQCRGDLGLDARAAGAPGTSTVLQKRGVPVFFAWSMAYWKSAPSQFEAHLGTPFSDHIVAPAARPLMGL